MGILLREKVELNRYEKAILNSRSGTREFRALVSGVSRAVRLAGVQDNEHLQTVWDTAANVTGPVFFFFIWWVLEEAKKKDVKRLYFVARDGQILLKIAEIMRRHWDYDVECRYLYGSRQAWSVPAIEDLGEFEIDWLLKRDLDGFLSINMILDRVNIRPEEVKDSLNLHGFPEDSWNKSLPRRGMNRIIDFLNEDSVKNRIKSRADLCFINTSGYLKQEKFFENVSYGLVDTGWTARSQFALSKILDKLNKRPKDGVKGFYLGLKDHKKVYKTDKLVSFLFDLSSSVRNYYLRQDVIYEMFAAADHGKTIEYSQKNEVFYPVFDNLINKEAIEWGVKTQQESIIKFADEFTKHCKKDLVEDKAAREILRTILTKFIFTPSLAEATAYGKYLHSFQFKKNDLIEVAPVVNIADVLLYSSKIRPFRGFWPPGSLARSNRACLHVLWRLLLIMRKFFYTIHLLIEKTSYKLNSWRTE
ncbi:MAG: hypothetical protein WBD17_08090 [Candidatus Omnitrophota bacterium]